MSESENLTIEQNAEELSSDQQDALYEQAKQEAIKYKEESKSNIDEDSAAAVYFIKKMVRDDEDILNDISDYIEDLKPAKEKIIADAFKNVKNKKALTKKLIDTVYDPQAAEELKNMKTAAFREKINAMGGTLHQSQRPSSIEKTVNTSSPRSQVSDLEKARQKMHNILKNMK